MLCPKDPRVDKDWQQWLTADFSLSSTSPLFVYACGTESAVSVEWRRALWHKKWARLQSWCVCACVLSYAPETYSTAWALYLYLSLSLSAVQCSILSVPSNFHCRNIGTTREEGGIQN